MGLIMRVLAGATSGAQAINYNAAHRPPVASPVGAGNWQQQVAAWRRAHSLPQLNSTQLGPLLRPTRFGSSSSRPRRSLGTSLGGADLSATHSLQQVPAATGPPEVRAQLGAAGR